MKKWQKALALLVGFGLTLGLAACGDDKDGSSGGSKKPSKNLVEGEKITVSFEDNDTAIYYFTPEREDNYIFMAYAGEVEEMISGDAGELYMYLYDEDDEEVGRYTFGNSDCGNPIAIAGDLEEGEKYTLELIAEDVTECSLFVLGEENEDMLEDILGEEFGDLIGGGGAQRPSDSDDDERDDNSDSDGDESDTGNSDSDNSDTDNSDNDNSDTDGSDSDSGDIDDPFDDVLDTNVGENSSNVVEIKERGQKRIYRFETNSVNNSFWMFSHTASRTVAVTVYDSNGDVCDTASIEANGTFLFTGFEANSYYYFEIGYQSTTRTGEFVFTLYSTSVPGTTVDSAIDAVMGTNEVSVTTPNGVYYVFTPTESGTYTFTSQANNNDPRIELLDAGYCQIDSDDDDGEGYNFLLTHDLEAGQTYYIHVHLGANTGSFSFDINAIMGADFGSAIEASVGTYTVTLETPRYAYYAFTPSETGTYNIYSTAMTDTDAYLYDSNQYELSYNDQGGGNGDFKISHELTAGYTYYIKVGYYAGNSSGTFEFVIEKEEQEGTSFETAIEAGLGSNDVSILVSGQNVYYIFTPNETAIYEIYSNLSDCDPRGALYDEDYNQITSDDDSGEGNNFYISYELTAGETYYIGTWAWNTPTYQIYIEREAIAGETFETAIEANVGENNACINLFSNGNYYVFTPIASGTYEFISQASDIDPRIALYSSAYEQIDYDDDSNGYPNFCLSYDLTEGETYYILIHLGGSISETAFTFEIELVPDGTSFETAIPFEFGNSDEAYVNTSILYGNSVYYTFTSEMFDQIYVFSVNSSSGVRIQVYYGEDHTSWGQCYAGISQEELVTKGTQYWVVFTANNSSYSYGSVDFTLESSTMTVTSGTYQTDIVGAGRIRYFKITNDSDYSRTYTFYSSVASTTYDTRGILYNAQGVEVTGNDDYNGNQYWFTYTIGTGETCYLASKMWNNNEMGTFYTNIEYTTNY